MRDDFERDVDEDQGSIDPAAHTRPPPSMRADQESPHHRWSYLGLGDVITLHGPPRPLTECLEQLRAREKPASLAHERVDPHEQRVIADSCMNLGPRHVCVYIVCATQRFASCPS